MALKVLLAFLLGLLNHLAGVCHATFNEDDWMDLKAHIYTNPYRIPKPYDCNVILALATKGQCMSYIGLEENPLESLASCELYCYETAYANTWDVGVPSLGVGGHQAILIACGMTHLTALEVYRR